MLVNGSTIFYDHTITEYTYYHIETEVHSVIVADGVMTESHLDTGNRNSFFQDYNIVSIANKNKEWNKDSAAPLVTAREIVEPIFVRLVDRAETFSFTKSNSNATITDSSLHLVTETGEILNKTHEHNGRFIFRIPAHITSVQLVSKTSKPSKTIGPFVDDRRELGVLVSDVAFIEANQMHQITDHLRLQNLKGWNTREGNHCRWTNGDALLNIKATPSRGIGMLVIHVIASGPYLVEQDVKILQQNVG